MIPNLTTEQRRDNLENAKAARQRRAAILKGVVDGSYSVVDVLNMALEDETVSRMKVFTLIKAAPGYGFARTQQTMKRLRFLLVMLAEHGEEETFRFMREVVLKGKSFAEESLAP